MRKLINKYSILAVVTCFGLGAGSGLADTTLFAEDTGFRIAKYRAPVPESPPGVAAIDVARVMQERSANAVLIDVRPVKIFEINEDGTWIVPEPVKTIPGAVWLPGIGLGEIEDWAGSYMETSLQQIVRAGETVIVFCRIDCWHSWNAVQRIAALGYEVRWFDGGVEAWEDAGGTLVASTPWPVMR
ncbi:MAG: rhodanese-like domain-containing protein [Pseudomonadota bacterium]